MSFILGQAVPDAYLRGNRRSLSAQRDVHQTQQEPVNAELDSMYMY